MLERKLKFLVRRSKVCHSTRANWHLIVPECRQQKRFVCSVFQHVVDHVAGHAKDHAVDHAKEHVQLHAKMDAIQVMRQVLFCKKTE